MGYFKRTLFGVGWQFTSRISGRIIGFVKIALIARILGPQEFGLFGVSSLILTFLETMTDTGIHVFLIQEGDRYKKYLNSAFVLSIFRGAVVAIIIIVTAPLVASFFDLNNGLGILFLISLTPFIRGFVNPGIVKYEKDLRFDKEMLFRISLHLLEAIVALYFTIKIQKAEGLVIGLIVSVIIEVLLSWILINPKPRWCINIKEIKYIVARGKWITLIGIFNYMFHNIDDIVVGKMLGIHSLGLYQLAYKISSIPIYETGEVFGRVTLPVYTKIGEDRVRLKKAFLKVSSVVTIFSLLTGIVIYIFAERIVYLFLGNEWMKAIPVIKILAVFGVLRAVSGSVTPLFYAIKKQAEVTKFIFAGLFVLILIIIPMVGIFDLRGAALSTVIATIFTFPLIWKSLRKEVFK